LIPAGAPAGADPPLDWKRATASVRVYGLNRGGLAYDHLEVLRLIEQRKRSINILMEIQVELREILADPSLTGPQRDEHERLEALVEMLHDHEIQSLRRFTLPERQFSQMAWQVIASFFEAVNPASP
jgi:hypothetical protein